MSNRSTTPWVRFICWFKGHAICGVQPPQPSFGMTAWECLRCGRYEGPEPERYRRESEEWRLKYGRGS